MTREEFRDYVDFLRSQDEISYDVYSGLIDVIDTLEQQPSDTVSRGVFEQVMWERDVAIDQLKELGYELGQKIESCDGAISRQAVLEKAINVPIAKVMTEDEVICRKIIFVDDIENLPPVTPQQKTGHWIMEDMFDGDVAYRCSECNELFWIESGTPKDNEYNFCPKCGKRLVEPQESEEI